MARRSGFFADLARMSRAAEKQRAQNVRATEQELKAMEKAQRDHQRLVEQTIKARERDAKERAKINNMEAKARAQYEKEREKERQRLHLESREAEVELKNATIADTIAKLEGILKATLQVDDHIDLEKLKVIPQYPQLYISSYMNMSIKMPLREKYLPPKPTGLAQYMPGAKRKYEEAVEQSLRIFREDLAKAEAAESKRLEQIRSLRQEHDKVVAEIRTRTEQQHAEMDEFQARLAQGDAQAILDYCKLVLESSVYPDDFPQHAKLAYVPESKQLVIEYDLPTMDVIPEEAGFKYIKARDEITSTAKPQTQRRALYASVIAQVTLRTVHEIFEADRASHIETVVFNGHVDVVDKATGRDIRPCLVTLRTTRDVFMKIDLGRVDPELCLKNLSASVSKNPSELAPVRPVVEFNMVDPRFVEEADVISSLDTRPNLMELTPSEFESLITNLFSKMGLDSRQTQASRDGGVDCVAWDPRPIFGGKVIIQAKRYKNTVGVSAVRDLFGTLQNEGASKGILVTTSGYGKAAFEFAQNKPLELLDGGNLLYLLSEHAGIEAKIEIPEAWVEPQPDSGA
jgi:restriction system protein